jgi:hypothetical protein
MAKYHVLWSGGLDSTYLIFKLLGEGHIVTASYCEITNNVDKTPRELAALDELCKVFTNQNFKYEGVLCKVNVTGSFLTSFSQMPLWITALLCSGARDADYVAIGYVMGDQAIAYLDDLKNIWKAYGALSNKKMPELVFPLAKVAKEEILNELSPGVVKLVTWCESSGKTIPCGKCGPCWTRLGLDLRHESPEECRVFDANWMAAHQKRETEEEIAKKAEAAGELKITVEPLTEQEKDNRVLKVDISVLEPVGDIKIEGTVKVE